MTKLIPIYWHYMHLLVLACSFEYHRSQFSGKFLVLSSVSLNTPLTSILTSVFENSNFYITVHLFLLPYFLLVLSYNILEFFWLSGHLYRQNRNSSGLVVHFCQEIKVKANNMNPCRNWDVWRCAFSRSKSERKKNAENILKFL